MLTYGAFQKTNNKGADQTARMRRLVCAFVVRKPPKTGFLATGPNYTYPYLVFKANEVGLVRASSNIITDWEFSIW